MVDQEFDALGGFARKENQVCRKGHGMDGWMDGEVEIRGGGWNFEVGSAQFGRGTARGWTIGRGAWGTRASRIGPCKWPTLERQDSSELGNERGMRVEINYYGGRECAIILAC